MNGLNDGLAKQSHPRLADLSVVLLSYNRREELIRNLESLCALQALMRFELIVVDNASTDGTREQLAQLQLKHPDLIVVLSDENLGVARGRNLGWRTATRAFILNLDDDTFIDLDGMVAMHRLAASSDTIGIVTPKLVDAVSGELITDYVDKTSEPANFAGACHLVRREVWERVGELDPGCSFGGEEIDYSIRARAAGYSTRSLPEVTVRHFGLIRTGNTGRWRREKWIYNYTRVFFKHFPVRHAVVLAARGLVTHIASGVVAHGPAIVAPLILNTLRGALAGRRSYVPLPEPALRFYTDPGLIPDFGQVPLWRKLIARLMRTTRQTTPAVQ